MFKISAVALALSAVAFSASAMTSIEDADLSQVTGQDGVTIGGDLNINIGAFTFGGVRDLVQSSIGQIGLGADVTFYSKPAALDGIYGKNPVSFHIFLRFRPGRMRH